MPTSDEVDLVTVGVDIGSATSHVAFSRITLRRLSQRLSSKYTIVDRQVIWQSPILFTPFAEDGLINTAALETFVLSAYDAAPLDREDISSGAVLLTGKALERRNARAVSEVLAATAGQFVCAEAGHLMEAELAAFGSGAIDASRSHSGPVLNVDIGGGTTKLALLQGGEVLACAALGIGGRLLAWDDAGVVTRVEWPAREIGDALGLELVLGKPITDADADAIAQVLASVLVSVLASQAAPDGAETISPNLWLTPPLVPGRIAALIFSGGVSEYVNGRETKCFGDIAPLLAEGIIANLPDELAAIVEMPAEGIRATIVGSCQFSTQVSGSTILLGGPDCLPVKDLPIVRLPRPLDSWDADELTAWLAAARARRTGEATAGLFAVAFGWTGLPLYARLRRAAVGLLGALDDADDKGIVLLAEHDVGRTLGRLVVDDLGYGGSVISLDGLEIGDYDYVDVSAPLADSGAVVVTVKSLLFGAEANGAS